MKKLCLSIFCKAVYNSTLQVPDNCSFKDALKLAHSQLSSLPMEGKLHYIKDSDELDEDNCYFEYNSYLPSVVVEEMENGCYMQINNVLTEITQDNNQLLIKVFNNDSEKIINTLTLPFTEISSPTFFKDSRKAIVLFNNINIQLEIDNNNDFSLTVIDSNRDITKQILIKGEDLLFSY